MTSRGRYCIVMPTYNNAGTVCNVVEDLVATGIPVIAVCDGATDGTLEVLESFGERITLVAYTPNRGKGYALSAGFRKAASMGYEYALSIDSDGQHLASDVLPMIEASLACPDAIIIGSRPMRSENMPSSNTFANRFSNFWFMVHTLRRIPDTQSGLRIYPLKTYAGMRLMTNRYEAELEMIVRGAWKGLDIVPHPVSVYYPPQQQRVSHFRSGADMTRISLLNTFFTFAAILYGYPSMALRKIFAGGKR